MTEETRKRTLKLKVHGTGGEEAPEPEAVMPAEPVRPKGNGAAVFFAVVGLLGVLACVGLLIVEWAELSYYKSPPAAFPLARAMELPPL